MKSQKELRTIIQHLKYYKFQIRKNNPIIDEIQIIETSFERGIDDLIKIFEWILE